MFAAPFERMLWIDADCNVLGHLEEAFELIDRQRHFQPGGHRELQSLDPQRAVQNLAVAQKSAFGTRREPGANKRRNVFQRYFQTPITSLDRQFAAGGVSVQTRLLSDRHNVSGISFHSERFQRRQRTFTKAHSTAATVNDRAANVRRQVA